MDGCWACRPLLACPSLHASSGSAVRICGGPAQTSAGGVACRGSLPLTPAHTPSYVFVPCMFVLSVHSTARRDSWQSTVAFDSAPSPCVLRCQRAHGGTSSASSSVALMALLRRVRETGTGEDDLQTSLAPTLKTPPPPSPHVMTLHDHSALATLGHH